MTVGRASLPHLVWSRHCGIQLRCKLNIPRINEEYKILLFDLYLYGLQYMVSIIHCRWYLPEKKQERMQIHNILQKLSQKQIHLKYALPVEQSSHRNIFNYSFNKLFNALRTWRVKICIIMLLVLNESSTEDDMINPIVKWLFNLTVKKKA